MCCRNVPGGRSVPALLNSAQEAQDVQALAVRGVLLQICGLTLYDSKFETESQTHNAQIAKMAPAVVAA